MAKDNEKKTQLNLLDRIADAVEDIASGGGGGGGGGGSELPAVTSADNGDVLTVVEGAWAKAAPKTLIVNISESEGYLVFDKTAKEVFDAINDGCAVYICSDNIYFNLIAVASYESDGDPVYTFTMLGTDTLYDTRVMVPVPFTAANDNDYPKMLAD